MRGQPSRPHTRHCPKRVPRYRGLKLAGASIMVCSVTSSQTRSSLQRIETRIDLRREAFDGASQTRSSLQRIETRLGVGNVHLNVTSQTRSSLQRIETLKPRDVPNVAFHAREPRRFTEFGAAYCSEIVPFLVHPWVGYGNDGTIGSFRHEVRPAPGPRRSLRSPPSSSTQCGPC